MSRNLIIPTSTRDEIREMLQDFASEEMQKRVWLQHPSNIVYYPPEIFHEWFDDIVSDPERLVADKQLTQEEWDKIYPFHEFLDIFLKKYFKEDFIKHPERLLNYEPWLEVRTKAKEALIRLDWTFDSISSLNG